jgi:hypothetical protein
VEDQKKAGNYEEKQDKDKVAHDGKPPDASGDGPYAKDGSVVWDVTNVGRIPWPPREISGEEAQARTRFFWA